MPSSTFITEMERQRGSCPRTKIEFIDKLGNVTNLSDRYLAGANLEQVRERAPDEIQAGQFDVILANDDDLLSEFLSGSLIYDTDYHGARIRISEGFLLPNGTEEFEQQGVGYIDSLTTDPRDSRVTFRCRDLLWRILDQTIHARPDAEIPIAGGSNVGDGTLSGIGKLPFVTVNQDWTITCDLGGADGVATFDVVGSIAGNIGTATSGTEFVNATHGIRFTIREGPTAVWVIGDEFTFSLTKHPEWENMNAGKIIWSILTGYEWDSDTQEDFADLVFDFDHTQSDANVHLDFESFQSAISAIDSIGVFDLKGFAPYDTSAQELLQSLIVMFLGSLYTGNDGRIKLSTYIPPITPELRTFADSEKISAFSYTRNIDEVINYVAVDYIASDVWDWSTATPVLDGHFVDLDQDSIDKYERLAVQFEIPWFSTSGGHVQDFASKLIAKYREPPINFEFKTGLDALLTEIGDRVIVEDSKLGVVDVTGEVIRITKQFDSRPAAISLRVRKDSSTNTLFGSIGSEVDEGDGISPQPDDYDSATPDQLIFAYAGDEGAGGDPDYKMF